jgi:hypothetical protein
LSPLISEEDCLGVSPNADLLALAELSVLEITLDCPSPSLQHVMFISEPHSSAEPFGSDKSDTGVAL